VATTSLLVAAPSPAEGRRFVEEFAVTETGNLQGVAYGGGSIWTCFDLGSGKARIVRYSRTGTVKKRSPRLPLGHCAEIAYRVKDGTIHAVDHVKGRTTSHVRVVDMGRKKPAVVKTINVTRYGLAGMIAIDARRDQLLVFGGRAPYRFNLLDLSGRRSRTRVSWIREMTYRRGLGIPQGLEVVGDELLFTTSIASRGSIASNRIHVFDRSGRYKKFLNVPLAREAEGLAVDPSSKRLYLGLHHPKAVYRMRPTYKPAR